MQFTHRSLTKVQAQIRLDPMTCEIVLHTYSLSSFIRAINIWELGKSKLSCIPDIELVKTNLCIIKYNFGVS